MSPLGTFLTFFYRGLDRYSRNLWTRLYDSTSRVLTFSTTESRSCSSCSESPCRSGWDRTRRPAPRFHSFLLLLLLLLLLLALLSWFLCTTARRVPRSVFMILAHCSCNPRQVTQRVPFRLLHRKTLMSQTSFPPKTRPSFVSSRLPSLTVSLPSRIQNA